MWRQLGGREISLNMFISTLRFEANETMASAVRLEDHGTRVEFGRFEGAVILLAMLQAWTGIEIEVLTLGGQWQGPEYSSERELGLRY